jgi:galactokinase
MPERAPEIVARFEARFGRSSGAAPSVFWAPGRVNLIGDHIDYCGGAVLPMPIQFGTSLAVRLNDGGRIRGASSNFPEPVEIGSGDADALPPGSWGRFLYGARAVLADEGIEIPGFDVWVEGNIPGSGLSSSASLSVGLLFALASLAQRPLAPLQLALAAQRIEHRYIGVQCGLMDQAVIALAEPGCALLFDCFDHHYRAIPFADPSVRIVVADTGRTRQLVHSAYNERLQQTRAAADLLGVSGAELARVDPREFLARAHEIEDPLVRRRARHVVSEAARVAEAAAALEARDWPAFGDLLCAVMSRCATTSRSAVRNSTRWQRHSPHNRAATAHA